MALGVLNNLSAIQAANNLNNTNNSLQKVLQQLSSGSRINSGADDSAGLSLVNGLEANQTALTQSKTNATEGVGLLDVADGALSQVTNLLDRAITLATEASNGTLNSTQGAAANQEYQSILSEINNIGSTTTYNQQQVFAGNTIAIYTGDSSTAGSSSTVDYTVIVRLASVPAAVRSGMSGTLVVTIAKRSNVLVVPTSALTGSSYVRVMVHGTPVYRQVSTGMATSSLTQITSGLAAGEVVMTGTYTPTATASATSGTGTLLGQSTTLQDGTYLIKGLTVGDYSVVLAPAAATTYAADHRPTQLVYGGQVSQNANLNMRLLGMRMRSKTSGPGEWIPLPDCESAAGFPILVSVRLPRNPDAVGANGLWFIEQSPEFARVEEELRARRMAVLTSLITCCSCAA